VHGNGRFLLNQYFILSTHRLLLIGSLRHTTFERKLMKTLLLRVTFELGKLLFTKLFTQYIT